MSQPQPLYTRFRNSCLWIDAHFNIILWPALLCAIIIALVTTRHEANLKNKTAPNGMLSLKWGGSATHDAAIIQSWKKDSSDQLAVNCCGVNDTGLYQQKKNIDKLKLAKQEVWLDYLFIFCYLLVSIAGIIRLQHRFAPNSNTGFLLLLLPLLAAVFNGLENTGLLAYINDGIGNRVSLHLLNAELTTVLCIIKYILLCAFLFIYLPYMLVWKAAGLKFFSVYIKDKSIQLYRYRVILTGVFVFALPLWMLDQGQDMLVNSVTTDRGVVALIAVLLITAFLNWYLAKLFFSIEYKGPVLPINAPDPDDPKTNPSSEKKISRFMGVCTLIIPAVSILQAAQSIKIDSWMNVLPSYGWLLIFTGLFYLLIRKQIIDGYADRLLKKRGTVKTKSLTITVIVLLGFVLPLVIRWIILGNGESKSPQSLIFLCWHLLLLALCFVIFVTVRQKIFSPQSWLGTRIGLPVLLATGLLVVLFILVNIFTSWPALMDADFMSLPVFLSGILFYILLFTIVIRCGQWKKINFLLITAIIGFVLSMQGNKLHAVKQITVSSPVKHVPLNDYFSAWVLSRAKEIADTTTTEYPVFLVNTYGGGIRASVFTSLTMAYLDSTLVEKGKHHKGFSHYVFAVSGASGGTIGAAIQCAYRERYLDTAGYYTFAKLLKFYSHDFLTPVLSGMTGSDIWASLTGLHLWKDRSEVQENVWAYYAQKDLGIHVDSGFFDCWNTADDFKARYEVPLLFSNTLNVDDGLKGICAPVALTQKAFPATIFINDHIDSMKTISLITGAFLSARFPYISPAGKIGEAYHFMDGGAKDNSGAGTSENIFISIARHVSALHHDDSSFLKLFKKLRFYFVSISNSPRGEPDQRRLVANRFEPISPLIGIMNSAVNGNALAADSTLQFRYGSDTSAYHGIKTGYCAVWPVGDCIPLTPDKQSYYSPVLPLGWQISGPALERLHHSFDSSFIHDYDTIGIKKILGIFSGMKRK